MTPVHPPTATLLRRGHFPQLDGHTHSRRAHFPLLDSTTHSCPPYCGCLWGFPDSPRGAARATVTRRGTFPSGTNLVDH